ncbi:methyltransferase domain-containing protein [Mesorhizobium sp. B2-3-13]|uniref:methyltransferase domain-containing protein n=1 Tax=Mesorhizobium sp. B2-3-13 TaxID=2589951 RepID=UPI001126058F|nr:methyltransferase domain-containing protein [Mesorhizobium sp. B2-3-13]TPL73973.1 methyltransferase domain-containing protein [Mesorhizobium sp. B2-3-13]
MLSKKLKVHVLFESGDGRTPFGTSYIRLLRPLGHPSNAQRIELSAGVELPGEAIDVVIVDRLWRQDLGGERQADAQNALFSELEHRGIPLVYALDDNLLDLNDEPGRASWPGALQRTICRRFIQRAAGVITSTPNLAKRIAKLNANVAILPNQIDDTLFRRPERHAIPSKPEKLRFGYMGTFTHLEDLLSVIQPVRRFISSNSDIEFEVVGVADVSDVLSVFGTLPVRLSSVPHESVEYPKFVEWMQKEIDWDFAIAPLSGSRFNDAKSDIKFLDYSALGVPAIYSDVPAYKDTVRHEGNGLLVGTNYDDWTRALERMAQDAEMRSRIALDCANEVWDSRVLATHAGKWVDAIERFLAENRSPENLRFSAYNLVSSQTERTPSDRRAGPDNGSAVNLRNTKKERPSQQLNRQEKLLWHIDPRGIGLEIGPGYNPLLPKAQGYRVETLDHAPADELRLKYKGMGVDTTLIEEVDFVWQGEPLDHLTGRRGYYDFVLASHVIEHTTDLVSFVQQCESMLKPGGVLSLAIPDCRYCFDIFRGVTTTGDVLQAFIEKRKRHTPGTIFDHVSLAAFLDGKPSWHRGANGNLDFLHTFQQAEELYERVQREPQYFDVHNWRFTPSSFSLIMNDLRSLNLIDCSEQISFDTEGYEFIVNLAKGGARGLADRLVLARRARAEISESHVPAK